MAIKKQLLRLSRLLLFPSVLCMFTTILTASRQQLDLRDQSLV
jgi:hypothetical protein